MHVTIIGTYRATNKEQVRQCTADTVHKSDIHVCEHTMKAALTFGYFKETVPSQKQM